MLKIPLAISGALSIAALIASSYIGLSDSLTLSDGELVQAQIGVGATLGALISATFVIYSFVQTNLAFIESQRPQLLVWVETEKGKRTKESTEQIPITFINYKNITNNQFPDLAINIQVVAGERVIDLSDLFSKTIMIGQDQRHRWFDTLKELEDRGFRINDVSTQGTETTLRISYTYTFNNSTHTVPCQRYKWNPALQCWELP